MTDDPYLEQARESFAQFYAEHRSFGLVILRVALGGTGIDLEDVASRMWVKIWETWRERGPLVEAPKAFIRQCARNAAIDALRTQPDVQAHIDDLDNLAACQWANHTVEGPPATQPGSVSETAESRRESLLTDPRLNSAVEELTSVERLVILTWIETFPPPTSEEIARILNIPSASTVRGHRMRALKKLRDIFNTPDQAEGGRGR